MSGFDDWDGKLGYSNPPPWSRFKKGQSGNPKGRPRKRRVESTLLETASDKALDTELKRELRASENGKSVTLSALEAVQRKQIQTALKGNAFAQREVLRSARELHEKAARHAAIEKQEQDADYARTIAWRRKREKAWADADKLGCEPTPVWPHPDDIIVDHKTKSSWVRGPLDESDVARYRWLELERDIAFACSVREIFFSPKCPSPGMRVWDSIWLQYDVQLPLRWQLVDPITYAARLSLANTRRSLEKAIVEDRRHASDLQALFTQDEDRKQAHRVVSKIMKPLVQRAGFRSLAHMQAVVGDED